MVAYKKLSNDIRTKIANRMWRNRIKNEIDPLLSDLSNEISTFLWNQVPKDVRDFVKGHEVYMAMSHITLYGYYFLDKDENKYDSNKINTYYCPDFKLNNIFLKMFSDNVYGDNAKNIANYLKKNHPELVNRCRDVIFKSFDIGKWGKSVLCVLNNITTANKLKDEFPEAFAVYTDLLGAPDDDCHTVDKNTGKKINMCDAIEKVRAVYNNSTKTA